jgi:aldose 1-epimerase
MESGKQVNSLTLKNQHGVKIDITNFGGKIMNAFVPDKTGKPVNVILGYDNVIDTVNGDLYFGAIIGRYANRIAKGLFSIDGESYVLKTNNNGNALHGGEIGYNAIIWEDKQEDNKLSLSFLDKDGREGYPGNLHVQVTYELTDNNELIITYAAETDKATPVNLTNHAYFNLDGVTNKTESVLNHLLKINAEYYTPIDETSIPTGEIVLVENTPFDFRTFKEIGKDIDTTHQQLKNGNGYDHNFVLSGKEDELKPAAEAISQKTGIKLTVYTTEPGVQLYTANFMDINEFGKRYKPRTAFCLETQHFPDSPNKANFPNTILRPGELFKSQTVYKFSV